MQLSLPLSLSLCLSVTLFVALFTSPCIQVSFCDALFLSLSHRFLFTRIPLLVKLCIDLSSLFPLCLQISHWPVFFYVSVSLYLTHSICLSVSVRLYVSLSPLCSRNSVIRQRERTHSLIQWSNRELSGYAIINGLCPVISGPTKQRILIRCVHWGSPINSYRRSGYMYIPCKASPDTDNFVRARVTTPWVFSQDLGFLIRPWICLKTLCFSYFTEIHLV